jgi:hypothetical protein
VKNRTLGIILGAVAGSLLGLLVAWIILDKDNTAGSEAGTSVAVRRPIKPGDVVALTMAAVGLVRQVATLRQR